MCYNFKSISKVSISQLFFNRDIKQFDEKDLFLTFETRNSFQNLYGNE